ncbi:nucleotidyltransferase family protein [Halobacterium wangiae]|uniref:nucleotidyltransferase family protein n=1 Tax=Halobacterium wangiae TaxID=2902623 RepID=UPI001E5F3D64|nr:nucleotidyltransferase family protein [Halobacterium wangiae]
MSLPVVDPPAERSGDSRVAGVLLAAGTSSRFGDANKLLADVERETNPVDGAAADGDTTDGTPMVRRSAETLLAAGLDEVVVVLGHEADRVREALGGLDVSFVENPEFESGQASSVRAGVRALGDVDAAVFALGDMPYVAPDSVAALVAAHDADMGTALAAGCDGQRGNPVLFDSTHFPALAERDGDIGGKQVLFAAEHAAIVETGDPGVLRDVDRPDEFA